MNLGVLAHTEEGLPVSWLVRRIRLRFATSKLTDLPDLGPDLGPLEL